MLAKSRAVASALDLTHVEFREGYLESVPVEDGWADVVISYGVINLCADKAAVFAEVYRVLRDGGTLAFADIANGKPVPEAAVCEIDLWTGCIAGGLPIDEWCAHLDPLHDRGDRQGRQDRRLRMTFDSGEPDA